MSTTIREPRDAYLFTLRDSVRLSMWEALVHVEKYLVEEGVLSNSDRLALTRQERRHIAQSGREAEDRPSNRL